MAWNPIFDLFQLFWIFGSVARNGKRKVTMGKPFAQICFARMFCMDLCADFCMDFLQRCLAWLFCNGFFCTDVFGTLFGGVSNHLLRSANISPRKSPERSSRFGARSVGDSLWSGFQLNSSGRRVDLAAFRALPASTWGHCSQVLCFTIVWDTPEKEKVAKWSLAPANTLEGFNEIYVVYGPKKPYKTWEKRQSCQIDPCLPPYRASPFLGRGLGGRMARWRLWPT